MTDQPAPAPDPKRAKLFTVKSVAMTALGFAAGLPFAAVGGTLYAWFTAAKVDVSTIGVLSWAGLAYGFKFLWSPLLDRYAAPLIGRYGFRRGWMLFFQAVIVGCLAFIAGSDPGANLAGIALASVVASFASASQDVVIDAWRIEVADDEAPVDILSAAYQMGFRASSLLAGAGALIFASKAGWPFTYWAIAGLMAVAMLGAVFAPPSPAQPSPTRGPSPEDDWLPAAKRNRLIVPVMAGWAASAAGLFGFMAYAVLSDGAANSIAFTRTYGPLIVLACVGGPGLAAALSLRWRTMEATAAEKAIRWPLQGLLDAFYAAVISPMADLVGRLRWGALLVLVLVLSYRFTDAVWGAFAYPFYLGDPADGLGALGHTNDEVAVASKMFGVVMTIAGIAGGGVALVKLGRPICLIAGAVIAAATNLLLADLAVGGPRVDAALSVTGVYPVFATMTPFFQGLGLDAEINEAMTQLMAVIAMENLALGFASAVFVAYLSAIVNPRYAAVQYALLASLTLLIGALGRGALGQLIKTEGYAYVFVMTAIIGLFAVAVSIAEVIRTRRATA
ncbi:MAG: beta-lactamase induction signal transducer [Pseudomonadota bacterium]